jgi:hypothetical protein
MDLQSATPEQMAGELVARGLGFMLIVTEGGKTNVYHPPAIDHAGTDAGLYTLVRDYLGHLEVEGLLHDAN